MKVSASRESLLAPLQSVMGVVERRQTMPVLANVLLVARGDKLTVTGTDLEVELVAGTAVSVQQAGDVTVPGRKLLEIMRTLPEKANVSLTREAERVVVKAGRSRFTLSSLPASEFPVIEEINAKQVIRVGREHFRRLIEKTHFAMAQQDVRYYLNGTMLETSGKTLRAVATDGHRLSLAETELAAAHRQRAPGDRAEKGHSGTAADPGGRRRAGTQHRVQSRSGPDRRHSIHFEADRR